MGNEVQIKLDMKGELAKKFKSVKEKLGLEHNTEVLRLLIKNKYDEIARGDA